MFVIWLTPPLCAASELCKGKVQLSEAGKAGRTGTLTTWISCPSFVAEADRSRSMQHRDGRNIDGRKIGKQFIGIFLSWQSGESSINQNQRGSLFSGFDAWENAPRPRPLFRKEMT